MSASVVIKTLSLFTATKIHFIAQNTNYFQFTEFALLNKMAVCQKSGEPPILPLTKY